MSEPAQSLLSHQGWLRRLARRLVASPSDADDLVQETYMAALRRPPPDARARPWLSGVMRKLALHHLRGERRRVRREESYQHLRSWESEPDELLSSADRERLLELVATLPEPFRSTVVEHYLEGLSCAEIARAQGIPDGTVRWRQMRALQLLRRQLERGRLEKRRPRALWPPLTAGAHGVVSRLLPATGRGKAVWVALAAVAIAVGLYLARGGRDDPRRAAVAAATARPMVMRFSSEDATDEPGGAAERADALARPTRRGASTDSATSTATGPGQPSIERRRRWLDSLREEYELALYDCEVEQDELRCRRAATAQHLAGRATCRLLARSLDAIELGRSGQARSPHTQAYLAAAAQVDQSLARRLGCALVNGPARVGMEALWLDAVERNGDDHRCESGRDEEGQECTTCTGPAGSATACGPVDCRSRTLPDGTACTVCTDASGKTETTCAGEGSTGGCKSELREYGLVCSTCPERAEECLVAACGVSDHCLECRDPKGRVGHDCTMDYEKMDGASLTAGGGATFNSCTVLWGNPGGSTGTCHYPGTETCRFSAPGDARCADCEFADGSGSASCLLDPQGPQRDPMVGRPSTLPPPGTCVTEFHDGMECSTCTADDLSADMNCRFPRALYCAAASRGPDEICLACSLIDGGQVMICDSAGS
jgi:RNA polymerase sigma-70 factor (ECF subfamily)